MYEPTISLTTDIDGDTIVEINQGPFGLSLTVEQAKAISKKLRDVLFDMELQKHRDAMNERCPIIEWSTKPNLYIVK